MQKFHKTYGEAIHFGPDEISFITAEAWKAIYGHGHQQLPKLRPFGDDETPDIIFSNDDDHRRFRKALSHGFSAKSLQKQEPLLAGYMDLLIQKLRDVAHAKTPVDIVKWYNLTTFDMIGDLAFGESFGGLESQKLHFWVSTILSSEKVLSYMRAAAEYPLVFKRIMAALPKSVQEAGKRQEQYVQTILSKRLNKGSIEGREDFIDSMIRHRGGKDGLTDAEMVSNASILVIAGSETTTTLLSGVTFWLLRAPSALQKVVDEVRSSFQAEDDITFQTATSRLPYMLACFNEALRVYPPVPTGLQRVTLPGQMTRISDYDIPPKTKVAVSQLAAYTSPMNFQDADKFIPERWLPDAKDDSTSLYYDDSREVVQPFSMGSRNCLGRHLAYNEMRLILARILWNFDIQLCEESHNWNDQRIYTLWDKPPMMCELKDRLAQS